MNEFTQNFHIATENKYPYIKIYSVCVSADGKKTSVILLYDKLSEAEYREASKDIKAAIKSLLPPNVYPEFEERAVSADASGVLNTVFLFFKENNVFLMYSIAKEKVGIITGEKISVKITMSDSVHAYFVRGKFGEQLTRHLNSVYFCPCVVTTAKEGEDIDEIKKALNITVIKEKYSYERENEGRVIIPTEREKFIGEIINDNAAYICDCVTPAFVTVCGNVSEYKIREYTKKDEQKKFSSFVLTDETGSVRCAYFPRKGDESKLDRLSDGEFLLLSGKSDYDEFLGDGSVRLMAHRISFAAMQKNFTVNNIVRLPNDDYFYVKPEKVLFAGQYSLGADSDESFSAVAAPLVLFELKTAATSGKNGVLLEIGAVKIAGGRVTHTFHSLIKPDIKLPPKLVAAIGINELDYIHMPSYSQILPDFYLFTQGCDITAYPSAENFAALTAAYRKLHIPSVRMADISAYVKDTDGFKAMRPRNDKSALACALAYSKNLL